MSVSKFSLAGLRIPARLSIIGLLDKLDVQKR